ncbi:hypothetical protein AVEN_106408-1 [Araneus ventricosus]|uniref:Uncharacterized protein n=1 Tax=Araneus ventricosus TaxID=182803 RepID=A0A4Y2AVH9_ARAVE|nr:hypothetical protein AVEN_106408-1 [Araneus ventricosus]
MAFTVSPTYRNWAEIKQRKLINKRRKINSGYRIFNNKWKGALDEGSKRAGNTLFSQARVHFQAKRFVKSSELFEEIIFQDEPAANHEKGAKKLRTINHPLLVANRGGGAFGSASEYNLVFRFELEGSSRETTNYT